MKKEEKIFDGITNVDDELIEEAKNTKAKKAHFNWKTWTLLAACLVLIVGIGQLLFTNKNGNLIIEPTLPVTYPLAYAFDDYETRFTVGDENPVDDQLIHCINDFAYDTCSLVLTKENKNTNYSPLSLYYALALATSGAQDETESELLDLLRMPDSESLGVQLGNLYRLLYFENDIGKLKIANSIWMDNDVKGETIKFKESFVENAVNNFYASSFTADFADEDTAEAMSDWIYTNTEGTISPDIELRDDQILSIINTIYFYDEWVDRFEKNKTAKDTFYLSDGNEVKVDFMNMTNSSQLFSKGENFTRSSLGLKNSGEMIFILPDEGFSPYQIIDSPEKIKEIFQGGSESIGDVIWKVPKFEFDSKLEMKDVLKKLGITSAFTEDADFSGMTDHIAFISNILQGTYISIDEKGVEASAYTRIDYDGAALPQDTAYMILDRPFIYGITSSNGVLLFVGICENPME